MRPVANHNAASPVRNSHFVQRVQNDLAFIRRLAVQRNAGNDVEVLQKSEMLQNLLGKDGRLSGGNGEARSGRFQVVQQLRNAGIDLVLKKPDGGKPLAVKAQKLLCLLRRCISVNLKRAEQGRSDVFVIAFDGTDRLARLFQRIADCRRCPVPDRSACRPDRRGSWSTSFSAPPGSTKDRDSPGDRSPAFSAWKR